MVYVLLLCDGRMDKWYWNFSRDDICDIVYVFFKDEVDWFLDVIVCLVNVFLG